jgi:hypothetical protein
MLNRYLNDVYQNAFDVSSIKLWEKQIQNV